MSDSPPHAFIGPRHHKGVLLSTANDIPGYEITRIHGMVYGTYVATASKGFRTMQNKNGEYIRYRDQAVLTRDAAANRLIDAVIESGGNAAYCMRFDTAYPHEGLVEVTCYGTAVELVPISRPKTL